MLSILKKIIGTLFRSLLFSIYYAIGIVFLLGFIPFSFGTTGIIHFSGIFIFLLGLLLLPIPIYFLVYKTLFKQLSLLRIIFEFILSPIFIFLTYIYLNKEGASSIGGIFIIPIFSACLVLGLIGLVLGSLIYKKINSQISSIIKIRDKEIDKIESA